MDAKDRDFTMFNNCINNKFLGCVLLSDCSFIVECNKYSKVIDNCQIVIEVPPITETFLNKYFKLLYPD